VQAWICGAPLAARLSLGPVYIIVSCMILILSNLGTRAAGEASAYSIFNTYVKRLPGEMTQEQVDNAFRGRVL
jgi:glutamate synthase domain-containing protein 1